MTDGELDVGCKFGQLSIGVNTANLGIVIAKGRMERNKPDQFFLDARLSVVLELDPLSADDQPGQDTFIEPEETVEAVVDVKGYSVNSKQFGLGLTFSREDVDLIKLIKFAQRSGRIKATRTGDAGSDD